MIGCSAAWRLAEAGASVLVLERSIPGAEASSAAAGILGAQVEAHEPGPLFALSLASRSRYAAWSRKLAERTGIDIEYRRSGVVRIDQDRMALSATLRSYAFQKRSGALLERWSAARLRAELPALANGAAGALSFPEDGRVDPPKLLRALRIAAERAGARFRSGAYVRAVARSGARAIGVALDDGSRVLASAVIVAAGSWSSLVEGVPLPAGGVTPARGQIVELMVPVPLFTQVVFGAGCYLVPRDDGRVLVGSTLEFVGYRREVTAGAVRDLLNAAITLVPALASATLERTWSSFRPFTRDGLPVLGETDVAGLLVATGHHRNGILLAPITADIMERLARGKASPVDLGPFSAGRRPAGGR